MHQTTIAPKARCFFGLSAAPGRYRRFTGTPGSDGQVEPGINHLHAVVLAVFIREGLGPWHVPLYGIAPSLLESTRGVLGLVISAFSYYCWQSGTYFGMILRRHTRAL